jgi:hypothetical protein
MNINKINQKIRYLTNESGEKTDVLVPLKFGKIFLIFYQKMKLKIVNN